MRSPVQSFPVDVHDNYANVRASMTSPRRSTRAKVWGLTAGAVLLGATLGWYLKTAPTTRPATPTDATPTDATAPAPVTATIETSGASADAAAERSPASAGTTALEAVAEWFRPEALDAAAAPPLSADSWPITLHRGGDGEFYADLSLDGHLVNARVDPSRAHSTLRASDLPGPAMLIPGPSDSAHWQASDVVLEHLRLPAMRISVSAGPTAESVIGNDLLAPYFTLEERIDRLRLIPGTG